MPLNKEIKPYFAVLAGYKAKLKESEKRDKYLDLARELKKTMKQESDGDTIKQRN